MPDKGLLILRVILNKILGKIVRANCVIILSTHQALFSMFYTPFMHSGPLREVGIRSPLCSSIRISSSPNGLMKDCL